MGKKRKDNWVYVADISMLLMHPIRVRCLWALQRNGPTSPSTMSKLLDIPLSDVSYNFRKLSELGAIELTGTEPVRGATRHFYAVTPFGEEVATWGRKMKRYGRKRERERTDAEAS